MALSYGFYNSMNNDRTYNAEQVSSIFDGIINDGVYAMIGNLFVVNASNPTSMSVTVGTGRAWFNHTWTYNDSVAVLTLDAAEVLQDRIDAVVLEVNGSDAVRENSLKIVKGTPSSTAPSRPTLTKDSSGKVWQYPLAYIFVGRQVSAITQANITNAVGTTECPFVTGIIQVTSLDELFGQWRAELDEFTAAQEEEFNAWFEGIQEMITSTPDETWNNLLQEIQGKQDALTFDSTPTDGSNNPVTSNGVYDAVSAVSNELTLFENSLPNISSGTSAPSGGNNGDLYFQYS